MPDFAQQYSPMRQDVAASVIDGEAIIMNLTNGAYYSIDAVGAIVWQWLDEEQSTETILQRLAEQYPDAGAVLKRDLHALLGQLLDEGLVQEGNSGNAVAPTESSLPATYAAPSLQKYTEMADLLALDPPMPTIAQPPASHQ